MTDPTMPPATAAGRIPGQRVPWEHSGRPDLGAPVSGPLTAKEGPTESYAHWWRRVVATLIDAALAIPFWAVGTIGVVMMADGTTITRDAGGGIADVATTLGTWVGGATAAAAYVGLIAFSIWNQLVRQGRRGASIGKACVYLVVVDDRQGRPIGVLLTFVRALAHLLDGVPLYLGYLWPLVDGRRQTFADKVMGTVVLHIPPRPVSRPRVPEQPLPYGW